MITYCILTAFINAFASIALGVSVLLKGPRKRENHVFAWFTASFAVWSVFYLLWQTASNKDSALLYTRLLAGASIFIPVTYFHFVSRLVRVNVRTEVIWGYLAALVICLFAPTRYLVSEVRPMLMFPYWPKGGLVFWPYIGGFAYFIVRAWMLLFSAFRGSTHWKRKQLGYVYVSTVIGWIGGLTNFLLWFDVPVPPVGNGLALVYIIGVSYAMIRFRLADMSVFLVKSAAYIVVVASFALLFQLGTEAIRANVPSVARGLRETSVYLICFLLTLVLVSVFPWVRSRINQLIEERESGPSLAELRNHIRRVSVISDRDAMFRETAKKVADSLDVENVAFYCRNEHAVDYKLVGIVGFTASLANRLQVNDNDWILSRAIQSNSNSATVLYEVDIQMLGDEERKFLYQARRGDGVEIVVPIFADTFFYGVLVCGSRRGGQLYSDFAISTLEALCLQIGVTIRSRQIERRANQAEKLISLGTLAAGLAHELRNPLVSIRTFSSLLKEQGGAPDPELQREFYSVVERDINRIGSIVEHVAVFAENAQLKFAPVQIDSVIQGVYDIARQEFVESGVEFIRSEAVVPPVRAVYSQLIQVFLNLFQNAVQALDGWPAPRIEVSYQLIHKGDGARVVVVAVTDNGPGIDDEVRGRIFDPFVTTKDTGDHGKKRGMGLGLSIVKKIVDGHGGSIDLASTRGEGTTFYVYLPCAEKEL